jgi:hypothetical protein
MSSELLVEGGEREWGVTRNWSGPSINIVSGLDGWKAPQVGAVGMRV